MKVIFLDFDGVLNSEASFRYEARLKTSRIRDTMSAIKWSNFKFLLDQDSSVKIVISSTWRKLHTLAELKNILASYSVQANIIGKTPLTMSGDRGREIRMWLEENLNVTSFVILDDGSDAAGGANSYDEKTDTFGPDSRGHFFQTTWKDGLLFKQAEQIAKLFRG